MRCINCGIAMQRLQRHLISSLSAHHQTRLSRWITNIQTQLPLDTFLCHPCFLLLCTEAGEHERLLGHNMVCLGCGKSMRKIRHHNVSMDCPLLAVLLSQNTNYVPSRNNYFCHVCWMRTNRQAVQDSSRDTQELTSDNNAAASNVQVVSPPEPPPLPPVQSGPLRRESNTLSLPNNKPASITLIYCIFQQCRNRMLHLVPQFIQRIYVSCVLFETEHDGDSVLEAILGYYCNCLVGNRTVGCCCHVMTIIWYLGWARHQNNIQVPAGFLDNILLTIEEY